MYLWAALTELNALSEKEKHGLVTQAYNPATWDAEKDHGFKVCLGTIQNSTLQTQQGSQQLGQHVQGQARQKLHYG